MENTEAFGRLIKARDRVASVVFATSVARTGATLRKVKRIAFHQDAKWPTVLA
jgi:hypothetical protein